MNFKLQLRERKTYVTYNPIFVFSKPSGSSLLMNSFPNSSLGDGYIFAVLPKSAINGKKFKITWEGTASGANASFMVLIYDGIYDRKSNTDFPTNDNPWLPTKGAGLLQTLFFRTAAFGIVTETATININTATLEYVTLFVWMDDGYISRNFSLTIYYLGILEQDNEVLFLADLAGTLTIELTGTYSDYGIIGSGDILLFPLAFLKRCAGTGYNCFMRAYLKAKNLGYVPLKLPDGTPF